MIISLTLCIIVYLTIISGYKNVSKNSLLFLFIILIILSYFTLNITNTFIDFDTISFVLPDGKSVDNPALSDPVRWWPSGVPQSATLVGSMVLTFTALTKLGVNPRMRVLGALGAGGVSGGNIIYHSAIENSIGFNRLMWSVSEYRRSGIWPSLDKIRDDKVNDFVSDSVKNADHSKVNSVVNEVKSQENIGDSSNFVSSFDSNNNSNFVSDIIDNIMNNFSNLFQFSNVSGYVDDLIGQQIALIFIMLFVSISLILLMSAFIINNLLLLNKDRIVKHFSHKKIVQFYLKYQVFSIKLSLFILPIFIFVGIITLIQCNYYLITHPIPYEQLGVDLHVYVDSCQNVKSNKP